jgi:alpha-aminoadipate/glutamate carrier protein LysW
MTHWHPVGRINLLRWLRRLLMAVVCPECDNPITVDTDEVEEGEKVQCDECGTELEVVSIDPLELAPVDVIGYDDEEDTPAAEEDDE